MVDMFAGGVDQSFASGVATTAKDSATANLLRYTNNQAKEIIKELGFHGNLDGELVELETNEAASEGQIQSIRKTLESRLDKDPEYQNLLRAQNDAEGDLSPAMEQITRRAGFDDQGNFQGLTVLQRDLLEYDKRRERAADIRDAKELGPGLTDAYRGQGKIQTALDDVNRIGKTKLTDRPGISDGGASMQNVARSLRPGVGRMQLGSLTGDGYQQPAAPLAQNRLSGADTGLSNLASQAMSYGPQQPQAQGLQQQPDLSAAHKLANGSGLGLGRNWASAAGAIGGGMGGLMASALGSGASREVYGPQQPQVAADTTPINSINQYGKVGRQRAQPGQGLGDQMGQAQAYGPQQPQQPQAYGTQQAQQAPGSSWEADSAAATGLRSSILSQAQSDLALGGALNPMEARRAKEAARSAAAARGRSYDTKSIVDEVAGLDQASLARKAMRQQFATGALAQEQGRLELAKNRALEAGKAELAAAIQQQIVNLGIDQQQYQSELGAAGMDVQRDINLQQINEGLYRQGLGTEMAFANQRLGAETATSADPYMAVAGKATGIGAVPAASMLNTGLGMNSAATNTLYDPSAGLGYMMANQTNQANVYAANQRNNAALTSSVVQTGGNILSSILQER